MADTVDSFVTNPLVQALGSHLGMDALFSGAGGDQVGAPPQPIKPPTMRVPSQRVEGATTPREFRQHAPEAKATPAGRGLGPGGGQPVGMNLPGVMSPDVLMHPVVQALLKQYGVDPTSAAQNADPNLFIPHSSAFAQNHPKLAGALEGMMEGGAFTKGSSTTGEGISNVLQGFLASKAARADKYNNQLMMPFAQAQQVQALQAASKEQELKSAQIRYDQAHSDYFDKMADVHADMAKLQGEREADKHANDLAVNHLKAQMFLGKQSFDDDATLQYKGLLEDAGGDPDKVDQGKLNQLITSNNERVRNSTEAGKNERAQWMYKGRVDSARIGATSKDSSKGNAMEKDIYDQMVKDHDAFVKNLNNPNNLYAIGPDGNKYRPGKPETKAYLDQWKNQIAQQAQKWQQDQTMATPGLMSPTTPGSKSAKAKLTYHPDGSIK